MKVLVATDDLVSGGTAQVARQVAVGLQARAEFELAFSVPDLPDTRAYVDGIAASGIRNHPPVAHVNNRFGALFDLNAAAEVLRAARPDVLVSCGAESLGSHLALKRIAKAINLPVVVIVNGYADHYPKQLHAVMRERALGATRDAASVVFVAEASRRACERDFGPLNAQTHVVTNACRSEFFEAVNPEARHRLRSRLGVADDELLMLCPARIEPAKGQDLIVAAMSLLREECSRRRLKFLLVGLSRRGYDRVLLERAARHRLADHFILPGPVSDMPSFYDAADVCILPSREEGMPLVVCEAMAKGRPVIATDVGDVARFVTPEVGALLPAPVGREREVAAGLADLFARIASRPEAFLAKGDDGRQVALRAFHPDRLVSEYANLVRRVVERASPVDWGALDDAVFRLEKGLRIRMTGAISFNLVAGAWSDVCAEGRWIGLHPAVLRIWPTPGFMPRRIRIALTPHPASLAQGQRLRVWMGGVESVHEVGSSQRQALRIAIPNEAVAEPGRRLEVILRADQAVASDETQPGPLAGGVAFMVHEISLE